MSQGLRLPLAAARMCRWLPLAAATVVAFLACAARSEAASTSIAPAADAFVDSASASTNYGADARLRSDASPTMRSYLRFNVQGLTGTVTKATLTITPVSALDSSVDVHAVSDNSWSEQGITYSNAPAVGAVLDSAPSATPGTSMSFNVTSAVTGNGEVTFAVTSASVTQLAMYSREAGTATEPQLEVETAAATADVQPSFPIRAAFYYPWFPEAWNQQGMNPFTKYHPSLGFYDSSSTSVIEQHVRAMRYGGIEAGIASWWGEGSRTDARIKTLLDTTTAMGSSFRWALYYEPEGTGNPTSSQIANDLAYIRDHYGSDPSYLRVNGRFVVFVYADPGDDCGMASRWSQANTLINAYIVLKVFSGYKTCLNQPDGWHQYSPAVAANSQPGDSFSISPGFDKANEATPRLARDPAGWNQNIRDMIASGAPWQLVTTFNEWGEGTSVESASEWASPSGYGEYLDALHGVLSAFSARG